MTRSTCTHHRTRPHLITRPHRVQTTTFLLTTSLHGDNLQMLDGEPDLLVVEKKGTIYCEEPGGMWPYTNTPPSHLLPSPSWHLAHSNEY